MNIGAAAFQRVLARDPRGAMEETLAQLMVDTGAGSAALFLGRGEVELLGGVSVDQACLDRARGAWREDPNRFRDSQPLWAGEWSLWPRPSGRGQLLLYLAGPHLKLPQVREAVAGVGGLLDVLVKVEASRVATPEVDIDVAVDSYLRSTTPEEVERRQLVVVLQQSEWNIARAARALGMTRATVYKRIEKFGIDRLRIRHGDRAEAGGS